MPNERTGLWVVGVEARVLGCRWPRYVRSNEEGPYEGEGQASLGSQSSGYPEAKERNRCLQVVKVLMWLLTAAPGPWIEDLLWLGRVCSDVVPALRIQTASTCREVDHLT
jgi:hypothetical protein